MTYRNWFAVVVDNGAADFERRGDRGPYPGAEYVRSADNCRLRRRLQSRHARGAGARRRLGVVSQQRRRARARGPRLRCSRRRPARRAPALLGPKMLRADRPERTRLGRARRRSRQRPCAPARPRRGRPRPVRPLARAARRHRLRPARPAPTPANGWAVSTQPTSPIWRTPISACAPAPPGCASPSSRAPACATTARRRRAVGSRRRACTTPAATTCALLATHAPQAGWRSQLRAAQVVARYMAFALRGNPAGAAERVAAVRRGAGDYAAGITGRIP